MKVYILLILIILSTSIYYPPETEKKKEVVVIDDFTKFAFGSNYYTKNNMNLSIFDTININNPQLWIWLGDIIQVTEPSYLSYFKSSKTINPKIYEQYNKIKEDERYKKLKSKAQIHGVWNDQDYGINNGDKYFLDKDISKNHLLDFLNIPKDHPSRETRNGVNSTFVLGYGYKSVRFILLDIRYNKEGGIFAEDMLGESQWNWLEDIFKQSKETFTFIVTPTQILPFNRLYTESWYSESRKRIFNLIEKYNINGVVFLSGDVGFAQILKTYCIMPEIGYDLYEITSSGNINNINYNKWIFEKVLPNDYNYDNIYMGINFGLIEFDWGKSKEDAKMNISIIDSNNKAQINIILNYTMLSKNNNDIIDNTCTERINRKFRYPQEYLRLYHNKNTVLIGLMFLSIYFIIILVVIEFKKVGAEIINLFIITAIFLHLHEKFEIEEYKLLLLD